MGTTRRSTLPEIAAVVAAALESAGFDAVLTGGACATIYSEGAYQSHDLDFVIRAGGDRYTHPGTPFFVEFPRGPLAIGDDVDIRPVELKIGRGRALALSPTDSCRDRLAAFDHWSDRQSLRSAVEIARRHRIHMTTSSGGANVKAPASVSKSSGWRFASVRSYVSSPRSCNFSRKS